MSVGTRRDFRLLRLFATNLVVYGAFFGMLAVGIWIAVHLTESWSETKQTIVGVAVGIASLVALSFMRAQDELREEERLEEEIRQAETEAGPDDEDDGVFDENLPDWSWRPPPDEQ